MSEAEDIYFDGLLAWQTSCDEFTWCCVFLNMNTDIPAIKPQICAQRITRMQEKKRLTFRDLKWCEWGDEHGIPGSKWWSRISCVGLRNPARSAIRLFFTLPTVGLHLSSSSDRTMIDVSQFKQAPPHMTGLRRGRELTQKQFYGASPLMELQRLNPS